MPDTSTVIADLDVLDKYTSLVKESLGGDSVYIRAKETIEALVADGAIDDAQKALVISEVIGGAVNGITSAAMGTALQWAAQEKELELKKLEMDQQLEILSREILLKEEQTAQAETQNRLALVESRRMYGIPTFDVDGTLLSLTDAGKVWEDILLVREKTTTAVNERNLVDAKIAESEIAAHKILADTYVNYGSYTYTLSGSGGVSTVTQTHGVGHTTLSDTQKEIAIEQGKGYTYNAWANALTGSASMLGTAIASDYFDFTPGSTGDTLLNTVLTCADNLKDASTTADEAVPGP